MTDDFSNEDGSFFHVALESAIATRKMLNLQIEQRPRGELKIYEARPQNHIFIVAPAGGGKSSVYPSIKNAIPDASIWVESFTEAGLKGTIDNRGNWSAGLAVKLGGKVAFVDEWNNLRLSEHRNFLSILDSQQFTKALAWNAVPKKGITEIKTKYSAVKVTGGNITGWSKFCCVACAMHFPDKDNFSSQISADAVQDAILSRFVICNLETSGDDALEMSTGEYSLGLRDRAGKADKILIKEDAYKQFHQAWSILARRNYVADDKNVAFISRTPLNILRLTLPEILAQNSKAESIIVTDPQPFIENLRWVAPMFFNYNKRGKRKGYISFCELVSKNPDMLLKKLADELGCSYRQAQRYKTQYELLHPLLKEISGS